MPASNPAPQGPLTARLKDGAAETALNTAGILRDLWEDFQRSDRYFKYKALVVGSWAALSLAAIVLVWPHHRGPGNALGARMKLLKVLDDDVLSFWNESGDDWRSVMILVNKKYSAAVPRVGHEPPENTLTVDRRKLLGDNGEPAPGDLRITDVELQTPDGRATLLENGRTLE